jgi:zinc/manganese transport system substrate-binding protein
MAGRNSAETHPSELAFGRAGRIRSVGLLALEFIAAQGLSSENRSIGMDIARIIQIVCTQHIPALFFENAADPRLARRIAAEAGARSGATPHADTLSATGGPAAVYLEMMCHNIREIEEG